MTTHKCPEGDGQYVPCCGKPVFELPRGDQITLLDNLVTCAEKTQHDWPETGQHLWGPWQLKTGLPKAEKYRTCVHPKCDAVQTREAAKA